MKSLIKGNLQPRPGDLVLARVDELGEQTKLELTDGGRAHDQYEAVVGPDMSPCDLVAAGGIAGMELSRHRQARIRPLAKRSGSTSSPADGGTRIAAAGPGPRSDGFGGDDAAGNHTEVRWRPAT